MNRKLVVLILMGVFVTPVMAEKPDWAGNGKPSEEQKAAHKTAMEAKESKEVIAETEDRIKEKKEKSSELKGAEKQQVKKSEQVQKELGKGSEKGRAAREENSKKWWKFWGE